MNYFFNEENIQKMLKYSSVYHLIFGFSVLFSTNYFSSQQIPYSAEIWQIFGFISIIFGIGYFIASFRPVEYWPIIFLGFLIKCSIALLTIKNILFGHHLSHTIAIFVIFDLIWLLPFYQSLLFAYDSNTFEDEGDDHISDMIKMARTTSGKTLYELSEQKDILLIFIRHFGCTFCRETVSEISKLDEVLMNRNLDPIFVHMSDPSFGDEFFSKYYSRPVLHISDPQKILYKTFKLKRGKMSQLFGPKIWLRGIFAGFIKGHGIGAIESDALQLGGFFILSKGKVIFDYKTKNAADFFKLQILPSK